MLYHTYVQNDISNVYINITLSIITYYDEF